MTYLWSIPSEAGPSRIPRHPIPFKDPPTPSVDAEENCDAWEQGEEVRSERSKGPSRRREQRRRQRRDGVRENGSQGQISPSFLLPCFAAITTASAAFVQPTRPYPPQFHITPTLAPDSAPPSRRERISSANKRRKGKYVGRTTHEEERRSYEPTDLEDTTQMGRLMQAHREEDVLDPDSPLVYVTGRATPTDLPTSVVTVDETALPYYLTQRSDGKWEVVDYAWKLYGREAGTKKDGVLVGKDGSNFTVEASLPRGWGQQSSRTDLYRVPLIVACSMILAVGIVIGIIILVFNRRKAHRKAKRRAERERRKALLAAGLDPNSAELNNEALLKEKLAELEKQHRNKRRKEGQVGFAKIKVKRWTSGLRRRRGGGGGAGDGGDVIEVIDEDKLAEQESDESQTTSGGGVSGLGEGSRTSAEHTGSEGGSSGTSRPSDDSPEGSSHRAASASPVGSDGIPTDPPAPYLPPEYRPASVRSYSMQDAGPSRRRTSLGDAQDSAAAGSSSGTEKTRAPGYYPAPATAEGEEALEVVSRAEGKRPLLPPPDDEESERIRHIATDDKRLLERMRLGASAPPTDTPFTEAGPSAPSVEVDQDGFERHYAVDMMLTDDMPSSMAQPSHPDLPLPPQSIRTRSFGQHSQATDELHLLPSAPPGLTVEPAAPSAPSAPPLASDENELSLPMPSAPPVPMDQLEEIPLSPPSAPSAPSFDLGETEDQDGTAPAVVHAVSEDGELESEYPPAPETNQPQLFLPKYEP